MSKKAVLIGIILFIACTWFSYMYFSKKVTSSSPTDNQSGTAANAGKVSNDYQALTFDPNASKTEACPMNGVLYGKDQQQWWSHHRPLGVMIENSVDARPQSGIPFADVTYEAVAEGGITRTLNVFYCQDAGIIGPVRSARTYFLDFISEYGKSPLYAHVGGANTPGPADALGQIGDYGWAGYNDMNQFAIGFPTYWRDESRQGHEVATEHTMYSSTSKLWDFAKNKRGLSDKDKDGDVWNTDFVPYTFKDDAPASQRPAAQSIHIDFWNGAGYAVDWIYDKATNLYMRKNGGEAHMDRNTHQQLSAKNVVILYMTENHANDGYENNQHMLYGTKGTGKAAFFMDGKQISGTWKKASRTDRTMLYDASGNAVKFSRGKLWFEIQPTNGIITVR
jgi:hypothetical protein